MKKKILLVETKCPLGHIQLYRYQIREYLKSYDVYIATTREYFDMLSISGANLVELPKSQGVKESKLGRKLQQVQRLRYIFATQRTFEYEYYILLSFDTHAMSLVSRLYDMTGVYLYVHNNIDELLNSKSKKLSFKIISNSVTYLVFEEYIAEFLRKEFRVACQVVHHERRKIVGNTNPDTSPVEGKQYVFCPSKECDPNFLDRLIEYCRSHNLCLVTKPHASLQKGPNIYSQDIFENYDDLFINAEYIACGVNYKYRVSGVLYEALGNDKKIIGNDCTLMRNLKDEAGEDLIILSESAQ